MRPQAPEENVLRRNTIRYTDPDSLEVIDVGVGMWLKARPYTKSVPPGYIGKVLRVDTSANAVRFDQGRDPDTGEDLNEKLEWRIRWERVCSMAQDRVFFDVVPAPEAEAPPPPETTEQKRARLMAELAAMGPTEAEPAAEPKKKGKAA